MRVGFRDSKNSVLGSIAEMDMASKWDLRRAYEEAEEVINACDKAEYFLSKLKGVKMAYDNDSYPECIILYNNDSELKPVLFDKPNMSRFKADYFGDSTTARPDVLELFIYDHNKLVKVFNELLMTGYIDFKDVDAVIMKYKDIPETTGTGWKMVIKEIN